MSSVRYRGGLASLRAALSRRLLRFVLDGRDGRLLPQHVLIPGDAVSDEMLVEGLHEAALLRPLFDDFLRPFHSRFAQSLALDVGANIGNHAMYFSRYFHRVIAVEPNPRTLHVLRANVALSGADITVVPMGFADRDGSLQFFSNREGNLGASGFAFADGPTDAASGDAIECPVRRGDAVLAELGASPVGFLKLDVEGAELSALRGLAATLSRDKPFVIFECLKPDGDAGGQAIFDFLRDVGYTRFHVVESSVGSMQRSVFAWGRRLLCGETVRLRSIEKPEAGKAYLMILAVPQDVVLGAE